MKKLLGLMAVCLLSAPLAKAYELKATNRTGYTIRLAHKGDNLHNDNINAVTLKPGKSKTFRMFKQFKGPLMFQYLHLSRVKNPERVGRKYYTSSSKKALKYSESKGHAIKKVDILRKSGIADADGHSVPLIVQTYPKKYVFGGKWPKKLFKVQYAPKAKIEAGTAAW